MRHEPGPAPPEHEQEEEVEVKKPTGTEGDTHGGGHMAPWLRSREVLLQPQLHPPHPNLHSACLLASLSLLCFPSSSSQLGQHALSLTGAVADPNPRSLKAGSETSALCHEIVPSLFSIGAASCGRRCCRNESARILPLHMLSPSRRFVSFRGVCSMRLR